MAKTRKEENLALGFLFVFWFDILLWQSGWKFEKTFQFRGILIGYNVERETRDKVCWCPYRLGEHFQTASLETQEVSKISLAKTKI